MYSLIDEAWNNISLDNLSDKIYESFEPIENNKYENVNEINNIYSDINTEDVLPDIKKSELKDLTYDQILNYLKNFKKEERLEKYKALLRFRNIPFEADLSGSVFSTFSVSPQIILFSTSFVEYFFFFFI